MTNESVIKRAYQLGRLSEVASLQDVVYRTYPGFNPMSSTLIGPSLACGQCLGEEIVAGTMLFFDRSVTPYDGSFVHLILRNPNVFGGVATHTVKVLSRSGVDWRFISYEGTHPAIGVQKSLSSVTVLVATLEFGPSWPRRPLDTAAVPKFLPFLGLEAYPMPSWPGFPVPPSVDEMGIRLLTAHEPADDAFARVEIVRQYQTRCSHSSGVTRCLRSFH